MPWCWRSAPRRTATARWTGTASWASVPTAAAATSATSQPRPPRDRSSMKWPAAARWRRRWRRRPTSVRHEFHTGRAGHQVQPAAGVHAGHAGHHRQHAPTSGVTTGGVRPATAPEKRREQGHLPAQPRRAQVAQRLPGLGRPAQVEQRRGQGDRAGGEGADRRPAITRGTRRPPAADDGGGHRPATAGSAASAHTSGQCGSSGSHPVSRRPRSSRRARPAGSTMRVVDRVMPDRRQAGGVGRRVVGPPRGRRRPSRR